MEEIEWLREQETRGEKESEGKVSERAKRQRFIGLCDLIVRYFVLLLLTLFFCRFYC